MSCCVVQCVLAQQIYSFWSCTNTAKVNSSHLYSSDCLGLLSRRPLLSTIWTPVWLKNRERKLLSLALEPEWQIGNVTDKCGIRVHVCVFVCMCVCLCVCLRLLSAVPLRDKALEVLGGDDIISLGWCLPRLSQDWDAPRLGCIPTVCRQHWMYHLTPSHQQKACGPHSFY